jgi:hypothetical protein
MEKIMFIRQLQFTSDISTITSEASNLLDTHGWGPTNQLCLTHRDNSSNIWHDASGSLYNRMTGDYLAEETEFNKWNLLPNSYIRQQIELLIDIEKFKLGRIRIMKLNPKSGLSVHADREARYHFVLKTNMYCYMSEDFSEKRDIVRAICYHIPKNSHWYKVDTTRAHWVYNGGNEERIHLVVCGSN